ncbi:MAG: branched-chain amino acid ABC transporter permease [Syntrophales bacterium]|nr:branched-chain amino acid ABC transporter permease [Syntrophales bacterium]
MKKLIFHPCGNFRESYEEELNIFETDFGRLFVILGIVLSLLLPFICKPYVLYVINFICIMSIAAVGLNILIGYTGQISLGHGAFFGVGAYGAAILATRWELPLFITIPAAGLISALVGMVFGLPSSRLKGLYLTIATLAGQFIIEYVLVHWESVTMGTMGITLPAPDLFGWKIRGDRAFFFLTFPIFIVMIWFAVNIVRTKYGRAFMAIRDNDRAAEGMGIPLFPYKLLSFGVSSFYAGVAGALFAYYTVSVTSEPFNLALSVEFVAMVIIGGLGSITGSVFGTVFIMLLNEFLRVITEALMNIHFLSHLALNMAPLREFTFGIAIVLFILFEPRGLAEVWRIIKSSFRLWPFSY